MLEYLTFVREKKEKGPVSGRQFFFFFKSSNVDASLIFRQFSPLLSSVENKDEKLNEMDIFTPVPFTKGFREIRVRGSPRFRNKAGRNALCIATRRWKITFEQLR